jgi:hypothetical protein
MNPRFDVVLDPDALKEYEKIDNSVPWLLLTALDLS